KAATRVWERRRDALQCLLAMSSQYALSENQRFPKNDMPWNIYITANKVFFIPVDKQTPELKKLRLAYSSILRIGFVGGAIGGALMALVAHVLLNSKTEAARVRALERLRHISTDDLERLEGYSCLRGEVRFEEKRKDNYRVHLGKDWVL